MCIWTMVQTYKSSFFKQETLASTYDGIYQLAVSWPTVVKDNPKAPFSKLLHRGVGKNTTPFPGLLHLP